MPAIPLPFVLSLLLLILLARTLQQGGMRFGLTAAFIAGCAILMCVVGLRWTFDVPALRFLQPIIAAALPPLAWTAFAGLARPSGPRWWLHGLPVLLVLVLSSLWQRVQLPVDLVLALIFFSYGTALLRLAFTGPDTLVDARLTDAASARKAALFVGGMLLLSGLVDLAIAADFDLYGGRHAITIVSIANMLTLPVIAYAIMIIGRSQPGAIEPRAPAAAEPTSPPQALPDPDEDARTLSRIERLMQEQKLYRDPDLTLTRLARRAGLPARQISGAINRAHGRNVSQVVNEYRIAEAQRLLKGTDQPVTTIMFDCGFQTKSNFNREFARVTGMTPSDYRRST